MFDFNQDQRKTYEWTPDQQAVIDAANENSPHSVIAVQAYAGTGKSTVLGEIAHQYSEGLYLAFNKAVVDDMLPKLPFGWECKTFNAMGLRLVKESGLNPKVNFRKFKKGLRNAVEGKILDYLLTHGGQCTPAHILSACQNIGMTGSDYSEDKDRRKLATRFKKILRQTTQISGNEMLWWPISMSLTTQKQYPILLIDEAVDMNILQLEFIRRIRTKKIVFMYDKWQNIYGFNGAVPDLEVPWLKQYQHTKFMNLPHSFRCPDRIINEVRQLQTGIQSAKPGGCVYHHTLDSLVIPDACLIIARFNADLLTAANILLKAGRPFSIKKRMLMKMVQFLDRIKKENSDIQSVISWLHKEIHKKEMDIKVNMNLSMTESINILEGALQLLKMGKFTWSGLEIVCNLMLKMSDENHDIKLATVHASKGLEHRHVIFMGINRMRRLLSDKNDNVLQEKNLLYVAVTRSMQTLVYVTV